MPMKKISLFIFILLLSICAYCENFSFAMLNVGQGLNIVVINDNKALIYDCGTSDFNNSNFELNKQCFDLITKPYLDKNNIKEIEYLVLSHPQTDHYIGFSNCISLCKINKIYYNGRNSTNRNYNDLVKLISEKNISMEYVFGGKNFKLGNADVEVLGPFGNMNFQEVDDNSIVLKITYKDKSFLLTGDISEKVEPYYIKFYGEKLKSDVLVLPGHGTKYSSSQNFLNSVKPNYVLISCGVNNPYHLPHPSLLKRVQKFNIYRTDINGNVVLKIKENKIIFENEKN